MIYSFINELWVFLNQISPYLIFGFIIVSLMIPFNLWLLPEMNKKTADIMIQKYEKALSVRREFEELYDTLGIRIIVESSKDCYEVLGILHAHYNQV